MRSLWPMFCQSHAGAVVIPMTYWTLVALYERRIGYFDDNLFWISSILGHVINSIICLVDTMISRRPWIFQHWITCVPYIIIYLGFTFVYWYFGGHGPCAVVTLEIGHGDDYFTTAYNHGDEVFKCEKFKYRVVDWEHEPLICICDGLLIVCLLIVAHGLLFTLTKFRRWLYHHFCFGKIRNEEGI